MEIGKQRISSRIVDVLKHEWKSIFMKKCMFVKLVCGLSIFMKLVHGSRYCGFYYGL
jgi:hypothetical protein